MVKSAATVVTDPDPNTTVLATAIDSFMERSERMTDAERKQIEKEIQGLKAKLRWTHISADAKRGYEARIAELEARLKG